MKKPLFILASILYIGANAQTISTIAGTGTQGYTGDGSLATLAEINQPQGVTADASGNIYIADWGNSTIRKVSTSGIITTIAGTGVAGYNGDGITATSAQLNKPVDVAVDNLGNIYIADEINERIRKIDLSGIITTVAGNGTIGYTGDGGAATSASFHSPYRILFDPTGNMYIADAINSAIRKINTSGIISTFAGTGNAGYNADGIQATSAQLNEPTGLGFDGAGNLYIMDEFNNRIRKVNTQGIITTVAGNGVAGYSGDGGAATSAEIQDPLALTVDNAGNIYFPERTPNVIRKISASGIISTIAGTGASGYSGDGGIPLSATFNAPGGICLDNHGNLYIADVENNAIRKISSICPVSISGVTSICLGGSTILTASGASSYTWSANAGGVNTSTVTVSPTSTTTYTLLSADGTCSGSNVIQVTVTATPILSMNGNVNICSGNSTTLTANGTGTIYWSTNSSMNPVINIGNSYSTPSLSVGITTYYIVDSSKSIGCINPGSDSISISVGTGTAPSLDYILVQDAYPHVWDLYINYSSNITHATWHWGDNTSTQGFYPSHVYTAPGKYNICVTGFNSCGDSTTFCQNDSIYRLSNNNTTNSVSQVTVINNNTASVRQLPGINNQVSIYPNPNKGLFIIETQNTEVHFTVYDVNGKAVLSQTIHEKTSIDASNLNEGVYTISLVSTSGVVNKKLIIVR